MLSFCRNKMTVPHKLSIGFLVSVTVTWCLYYVVIDEGLRHWDFINSDHITVYKPFESIDNDVNYVVNHGYLVDGPRCHIPNVDPYDKQIRKYVKSVSHISCSKQPPLTYVTKETGPNGTITITLKVDKHLISSYSPQGVQCCYSNITRGWDDVEPDDKISISKCQDFKDSVNLTEPFVLVKCVTRNRKKNIYKNAHAVINIPPKIKQKIDKYSQSNTGEKPLSVLMVAIDSISRLNSIRTMPRTLKYLDVNGWIELKGYNKIADNTFPNVMAILTGLEGDAAYDICKPTKLYQLENCSFVWTKYRDNGYVTGYGEDSTDISTFNYHKLGFVHEPTDYYLRPYMKASEKELRIVKKYTLNYCVGPVTAGERILSYAKDFASTFANYSNFALFWMNSFSHNDLNMPSAMDNKMLEFFEGLSDRGVNENSIIIFFSDHGIRFGKIRSTYIGWLEERLPFVYIHVPKWFKEQFPQEYRNLQINANRLTTPYDLHMTLQDVLKLVGKTDYLTPSSGCPKCQSLFSEISNERSCKDAAISQHWCVCNSYENISTDDEVVQKAAAYVLDQVQNYVIEAGPEISKLCANLTLSQIIRAQVSDSRNKFKEINYLIYIETKPGLAKFEATLSYRRNEKDSKKNEFQLYSSISRLDAYKDQSYCISDATLKKYCYCR